MLTTPKTSLLRQTLDTFPVAMFAAQRSSKFDAFRILCVNQAHEAWSGIRSCDIEGLRPKEILPLAEGEAVESRYAHCIRSDNPISYEEVLHLSEQPSRWRTTLFPVRMPDGLQRLIGAAFALDVSGSADLMIQKLKPFDILPDTPAQLELYCRTAGPPASGRRPRAKTNNGPREIANSPEPARKSRPQRA